MRRRIVCRRDRAAPCLAQGDRAQAGVVAALALPAMLRAFVIFACVSSVSPALAIVGGRFPPYPSVRDQIVIVSSPGGRCSGTLIARDLVLTAAHCTRADGEYRVRHPNSNHGYNFYPVDRSERHPRYNATAARPGHAFDIALLHLAEAFPEPFAPRLVLGRPIVRTGDELAIAGFGISSFRWGEPQQELRMARLIVNYGSSWPEIGQSRREVPSYFGRFILLHDPGAREGEGGISACNGDSGGPAFYVHGDSFPVGWHSGQQRPGARIKKMRRTFACARNCAAPCLANRDRA